MNVVTASVKSCARCGVDHPELAFRKFDRPIDVEFARVAAIGNAHGLVARLEHDFTHWATCPTTREPIILRFANT